jgi:hypothetical protein
VLKKLAYFAWTALSTNVHCLWAMASRPKESHRLCDITAAGTSKIFCSCGFNNRGVTFDQEIQKCVSKPSPETRAT